MHPLTKAVAIGIVILSTEQAHPQGIVHFANQPLGRRVFDVDGISPLSGTNFISELLFQDNTGTWVTHPMTARFYDTSLTPFGGYWSGGNRTLVNAGGVPNPMDPTRALPVNMQVRVWDGGSGMVLPLTFEQAVAGGMRWGTSDVFSYIEEFDLQTDNTLMKNFQSFSLVPEPSAWALFALGMGWLVWRSRKHRMSDAS